MALLSKYNSLVDYGIILLLIGKDGGVGKNTCNARKLRYYATTQETLVQGVQNANNSLNALNAATTGIQTGITTLQNTMDATAQGSFKTTMKALFCFVIINSIVAYIMFVVYK